MTRADRLRISYLSNDLLTSWLGMLIFDVCRFQIQHLPEQGVVLSSWLFTDPHLIGGMVLVPLLFASVSWIQGQYSNTEHHSRFEEISGALISAGICAAIVFLTAMLNDVQPRRMINYRLILILLGCLFVLPSIGRTIITWRQRLFKRAQGGSYTALIVGTPSQTERMMQKLTPRNSRRVPVFKLIGQVRPKEAAAAVARLRPDAVIVVEHGGDMARTVEIVNTLYPTGVEIYLTPGLYSMITSRTRINDVVGEPLVNITTPHFSQATMRIKRLADISISAVALVALLPLFALLAVLVKSDSTGPVFYTQKRVGYRKKEFSIIKFRSMHMGAEASGPQLSQQGDPRITRVGAVLRKYRLDELPQFYNVLRGDMSLVGPRPERPFFVEQIVKLQPHYSLVHQVRPGITSWGVVKYGYASSVEQMIERVPYDLVYIENVSLGVDIKIIFHTINTVISGRGV